MSDSPENKSSTGLSMNFPSEMRLSRAWDDGLERLAWGAAIGGGEIAEFDAILEDFEIMSFVVRFAELCTRHCVGLCEQRFPA